MGELLDRSFDLFFIEGRLDHVGYTRPHALSQEVGRDLFRNEHQDESGILIVQIPDLLHLLIGGIGGADENQPHISGLDRLTRLLEAPGDRQAAVEQFLGL